MFLFARAKELHLSFFKEARLDCLCLLLLVRIMVIGDLFIITFILFIKSDFG